MFKRKKSIWIIILLLIMTLLMIGCDEESIDSLTDGYTVMGSVYYQNGDLVDHDMSIKASGDEISDQTGYVEPIDGSFSFTGLEGEVTLEFVSGSQNHQEIVTGTTTGLEVNLPWNK